jgi:N-acyl amino acid synthase of PEP-CTERM/exosortase system
MPAGSLHSLPTISNFQQLFDVQLADTEELRRRVSQVRYQVFCEELGFGMSHRDGHEQDDYDASSVHCLIHHRPSGTDVGCVRLVLPGMRGGNLPFEKFGLRHVDRKLLDWRKLDPTRCCEISRLAVTSAFRRPIRAQGPVSIDAEATLGHHAKRLPTVVMALYQAVIALTLSRQFEHIFMVGEPRLQRHLGSCGIAMQQISPTFEYFGPRAVFVADNAAFQTAINEWDNERKDLYRFIYSQMAGSLPQMADDDMQSVVA